MVPDVFYFRDWVYELLSRWGLLVLLFAFTGVWTGVVVLVTWLAVHSSERRNVVRHLDEAARHEVGLRDDRIALLEERLRDERRRASDMAVGLRGVKNIVDGVLYARAMEEKDG